MIALLLLLGLLSLGGMMAAVYFGNVYVGRMIAAINQRRPRDQFISHLGFTPAKLMRTFRGYRSFYPDGKLHLRYWIALAFGVACLGCLFICLRWAGHVAR